MFINRVIKFIIILIQRIKVLKYNQQKGNHNYIKHLVCQIKTWIVKWVLKDQIFKKTLVDNGLINKINNLTVMDIHLIKKYREEVYK
jgi:hypothetical protein